MTKTYFFKEIDSTNAKAIRCAKAGEADGAIFVSDSQTVGRGRLGRTWESPPGKNLYVSFLFRPQVVASDAVPMTRLAAHVMEEVLKKYVPSGLKIKWPNDILIHGKKVCGILCEMGSEKTKTQWVVCGLGINVNAEEKDFSPEVRKTATSLKIVLGRDLDREEVLGRVIDTMKEEYAKEFACH
jgi:BirA family transcriptional regulator, biotin operon repressor / biotin---[acetyl-CoA-carboxylase] ligase